MHSCHIEAALSSHGLRNTVDRHRILELFELERAWTASEVSKRLRGTDLSTVYRNIQTLFSENLIVRISSHEGESRYEAAERPHHDHLTCQRCDAVVCVPCPIPTFTNHILEFAGTCVSCR